MKILITGAHGMVGKNLVKVLRNKKYKLLTPTILQLNLKSLEEINEYLHLHKPDIIVHLASVVGSIKHKNNYPYSYLSENISIDNNLINAAFKNNIRKLINISSLLIYPCLDNEFLTEDLIMKDADSYFSKNPYATSKALTIKLCNLLYEQNNKFRFITLVPCSIFGCYDNYNTEKSHFIASSINKIHSDKSGVVKIWGDGKAYREVIFAEDFAKIILNVIQKYDELPRFINVGSGLFMSITDYYNEIGKILGFKGKFEFDKTKPSGITVKKLDNSILLSHIPFKFKRFSDAIKITYEEFILRDSIKKYEIKY